MYKVLVFKTVEQLINTYKGYKGTIYANPDNFVNLTCSSQGFIVATNK